MNLILGKGPDKKVTKIEKVQNTKLGLYEMKGEFGFCQAQFQLASSS